jgi:hypothetical protein
MRSGRARWLEPIGQTIAFVAFSLQFFVVDPASNNALRGSISYQRLLIEGMSENPKPGTLKEAQDLVKKRDLLETTLDEVEKDDARKSAWRGWLFLTFGLGALLTILGKAASVKYSTR